VPVVATTPNDRVRRQLTLSWGIDARVSDYHGSAAEVMDDAVTAALDAGVARSGDTIVILSGMMSDLDETNTTNMLKVHVVAEAVANGRKIVGGRVAGPLYRTADGDLSGVPEGAVLYLDASFDGEFDGDARKLGAIVDARPGLTGYPAMVARELDIPMISGAPVLESVAEGTAVTLHAERGIVYEGNILAADDRDRHALANEQH
jgi:pyruvate kinase